MYQETIKSGDSINGIIFTSENLVQAYNRASELHKGTLRKSGEPYFNHCVEVLKIIHNQWGIHDEKYLIAALLHDTVEDTGYTLKQLRQEFGLEVADLVEGVTKLDDDKETLSKVLDKSYLNPGVAIIKLADRLHNMRTLGFMKPEKQHEKARETMEVYTKLAESLGMWEVKTELEDLSYQYLNSKDYLKTKTQIDNDPRRDTLFLAYVKSGLEQLLEEKDYRSDVESRFNGYWALKHKQKKDAMQGKCDPDNFSGINDLVSFRISLAKVEDCYRFLKILHEKFGDMVDYDRFDEFIGANKRINGYEAIQTTINFPQGPVEIALVTSEMEEFNNHGVLSLIKNDQQSELKKYVLKLVFTPTGGIRFLSKNGTGVDFAALINPRLLADAEKIIIDGVEMPISSIISNASTVEVITSKESRRAPLVNLEKFCDLPKTRKTILEQRKLAKRDIFINQGKEIMEKILSPRGLFDLSDLGNTINPILYNFGCQGCDDLYFLLGNGALDVKELKQELNRFGINKKCLQLTSIKLSGQDHPRILIDVIKLISDMDANIIHISQENQDGTFNLRIIVKGLVPQEIEKNTENKEKILSEILKNDSRFAISHIV